MGVTEIEAFDEDGVDAHNLPNQFYRKEDLLQFKTDALALILHQFTDAEVLSKARFYKNQPLQETVVVATDSMSSRKLVWEQFLKQPQARVLIEARMGAEMGIVYTIVKTPKVFGYQIIPAEKKFYEEMLYPDSSVKPLPCTAKTIIYNVLMLASLISRAYKGVLMGESVPKEMTFSMTNLTERSWMVRDEQAV